jgi:uncharacterized membrane protein YhaH (DUF805 family)
MDWTTLLFSFRGRINRAKYWLTVLIYAVAWVICLIVVAILTGGFSKDAFGGATVGSIVLIGLMWIFFVLWSGTAVAIKRLHDRNKSGWWLLLFWLVPNLLSGVPMLATGTVVDTLVALVSFVIWMWGIVEIGFLKGTTGPNDYGPDPLPTRERACPQPSC